MLYSSCIRNQTQDVQDRRSSSRSKHYILQQYWITTYRTHT